MSSATQWGVIKSQICTAKGQAARITLNIREKNLLSEGGQALEQVVQGDCTVSILGDTQSSAALCPEQFNATSRPPLRLQTSRDP